ncbi:hypothetical protein EGC76_11745 [Pseudidiomarina gelatinasegens]|uniref:Uncharacterized protein n=1 Tax=Pseudidiomarina gelatinasegens TaxID=2487740 RepID=A0A443YVN6_9GAMM|nr:hypothetical protein [Pseudidiomarina gelatinasegens]RWU07971.1 hypothetical protein EGC76_11745 [Pseudidiomarina gelatinasegens]
MQISTTTALKKEMIKRSGEAISFEKYNGKSSFEVSVGTIIHHSEDDSKGKIELTDNSFSLKPQETVYVVSRETIHVPKGYVAYVFLKNQFSQEGLLAFNTGIIDGGFNGPISTLVTNLSSNRIQLGEGYTKEFFRVVFHQIDMNDEEIQTVTDRDYTDFKQYQSFRRAALTKMPKYFLDREELKRRIDESLNNKAQKFGFWKLSGALALFSSVIIIIPSVSELVRNTLFDTGRVAVLEQRIEELEKQSRETTRYLDEIPSTAAKPKSNNSKNSNQ